MSGNVSRGDIDRMRDYLNQAERDIDRGVQIAKSDFRTYLEQSAAWMIDRIDAAWEWLKRLFN